MLSQSGGTAAQVLQEMEKTAIDIDTPGWDPLAGNGLVQATAFTPTGGGGGGGGPPTFPPPQDRFEAGSVNGNYQTSDKALNLGTLQTGTQALMDLTIANLPDGLPDYNWFRITPTTSGTLSVTMPYLAKWGRPRSASVHGEFGKHARAPWGE